MKRENFSKAFGRTLRDFEAKRDAAVEHLDEVIHDPTPHVTLEFWRDILLNQAPDIRYTMVEKIDEIDHFIGEVVKLKQVHPNLSDLAIHQLVELEAVTNPCEESATRLGTSALLLTTKPDTEASYLFKIPQ